LKKGLKTDVTPERQTIYDVSFQATEVTRVLGCQEEAGRVQGPPIENKPSLGGSGDARPDAISLPANA
jgi:hypothetical protein